jgi:hypothetical protein
MILLSEIQYFPTINLFNTLNKIKHLKIEAYETYQKGSFRNRCFILGANGIIPLSIPLEEGRAQRKLIREVRISNTTNWQLQHWKAIETSYRRSPWFEHYAPELKTIYSKKIEFLFDWNMEILTWSLKKLNLSSVPLSFTSEYIKSYDKEEYLDLRSSMRPSNYMNFEAKTYPQVFADRFGFVPNLSILDLLMNEGKMASNYF